MVNKSKLFAEEKENKTKGIYVRVDEQDKADIKKYNIHTSDVVRGAIKKAIAKAKAGSK